MSKLKEVFEARRADFVMRMAELKLASAKRVLDGLTPDAKLLFVQYAGNEYLPHLSIGNPSLVLDIYQSTFRSFGLFERYLPRLRASRVHETVGNQTC